MHFYFMSVYDFGGGGGGGVSTQEKVCLQSEKKIYSIDYVVLLCCH
jgi:hypothetical protein